MVDDYDDMEMLEEWNAIHEKYKKGKTFDFENLTYKEKKNFVNELNEHSIKYFKKEIKDYYKNNK